MLHIPERGVITLAFDDAYLDTYTYAISYLNKLRIKSTVAAPSSFIGRRFENRRVVGIEELKDIIKSGHEIASHTVSHPDLRRLDAKDKEGAIVEIAESKKRLETLLGYRVSSFVFPYMEKKQTKRLRLIAQDYYKSSRITLERPCFNQLPLKDPYSILGFSVMRKHSLAYLKGVIDCARKNTLWLTEVFHLVGRKNTLSAHRPKPYRFFIHIDDFKRHVEYILSKNIPIVTQREAVRRFSNGI